MYVTKEDLERELSKYKESCTFSEKTGKIVKRGYITPELGKMIKDVTEGLSSTGSWRGYTWKEDMVGEGILTILKYMHNFKAGNNAHAYLSLIAQNAFIQYIQKQKKHSTIKDKLYDSSIETDGHDIEKSIDYEKLNKKE